MCILLCVHYASIKSLAKVGKQTKQAGKDILKI